MFIFIDIILPALTKTEQIFPGLSYQNKFLEHKRCSKFWRSTVQGIFVVTVVANFYAGFAADPDPDYPDPDPDYPDDDPYQK